MRKNKMNDSALLIIGSISAKISFEWSGFDGDDCFKCHRVICRNVREEKTFDFGACSAIAIRKTERFLNEAEDRIGAGFRIPEIIYYDLERKEEEYFLHIYSEELKLDYKFTTEPKLITFEKSYQSYYK